MQKQHILGLTEEFKKILKNEKGTIFYLNIVVIMILMMFFAGMVELGRIMIIREQLQTASDAAALVSASSSATRFVKINVKTDRGQMVVCNEDSCWCISCGIVTISNIYGDEKTLLDEGGWRDFCVEPCDCSGGDCWYELVDREILYETPSADSGWRGWGTDMDFSKLRNDLTITGRQAVAYKEYGQKDRILWLLSNKSLEEISSLLDKKNRNKFADMWVTTRGYSYGCNYECQYRFDHSCGCYTLPPECYTCKSFRNYGYTLHTKLATSKEMIDKMIASLNRIEAVNKKPAKTIQANYLQLGNQFFEANKPKHADNAGIIKQTVYGRDKRDSPYYPSVVVYAMADIKSLFPKWFGDSFQTVTCSQATTVYKSVTKQTKGGNRFYSSLSSGDYDWRKVPENACWVDF